MLERYKNICELLPLRQSVVRVLMLDYPPSTWMHVFMFEQLQAAYEHLTEGVIPEGFTELDMLERAYESIQELYGSWLYVPLGVLGLDEFVEDFPLEEVKREIKEMERLHL